MHHIGTAVRHNPQSNLQLQYISCSSRIRAIAQYHKNNDYGVHTDKTVNTFKPTAVYSKRSLFQIPQFFYPYDTFHFPAA
jgi:hypothetical protein